MPKNTKGGSGHKRQARKHTSGGYQNNRTRFSEDPLEMYAVCTKLYGQGHIEVMCHDAVSRMCVIRKKFKGRGKRDNNIIERRMNMSLSIMMFSSNHHMIGLF